MRFDTFGEKQNKSIMLLPGTCSTWQTTFDKLVPELEPEYYVICVDYDGFDHTDSDFVSMLDVTEKIEAYVLRELSGKLDMAFGASMGGSFVGLLLQRKRIHIDSAVLGSTDLDQSTGLSARIQAKLVADIFYAVLKHPKLLNPALKLANLKMGMESSSAFTDYMQGFMKEMSFIRKENLYRQFLSDLETPLENSIDVEGTTVHILYTDKMSSKLLKRYYAHFKNPVIHQYHAGHGDFVFLSGQEQRKMILDCFNEGRNLC